MKVALSGSAGTGRSTIAMRLAQSINHTPLTNMAKGILRQEGFKYGTEVTVEKFLATPERQMLLFDHKRIEESKYDNIVTDRSWIDHAAYSVIGLHENYDFDISSYLSDCRCEVEKFDSIIHIPWGRQPLQPNGSRTINPWFQFMVDAVICRIAEMWGIELTTIPEDLNNKEAVDWIVGFLKTIDPNLEIIDLESLDAENQEDS